MNDPFLMLIFYGIFYDEMHCTLQMSGTIVLAVLKVVINIGEVSARVAAVVIF